MGGTELRAWLQSVLEKRVEVWLQLGWFLTSHKHQLAHLEMEVVKAHCRRWLKGQLGERIEDGWVED